MSENRTLCYSILKSTDLTNTSLPTTTDVMNGFVSSAHGALENNRAIHSNTQQDIATHSKRQQDITKQQMAPNDHTQPELANAEKFKTSGVVAARNCLPKC